VLAAKSMASPGISAASDSRAPEPRALGSLLRNRRWRWRALPFPHVVAQNVFRQQFHLELTSQLHTLLNRGLSEAPDPERLSRTLPGYDAYSIGIQSLLQGPLGVFSTRQWHDMLAKLFGIQATGHINCGVHHHSTGSDSGWVHNDLNPGWFVEGGATSEVILAEPRFCNYQSGKTQQPGASAVETIRAVALLYYFGNDVWQVGDGGGTGLYRTRDTPVHRPDAIVAPINNSLLAFECTPHSFHSFMRNHRAPRTCVIMWLHRAKAEVVSRWGEGKVVQWPQ
jgi:hypothetical protein